MPQQLTFAELNHLSLLQNCEVKTALKASFSRVFALAISHPIDISVESVRAWRNWYTQRT